MCVCVHPCATTTSISARVCVFVCVISLPLLPLPPLFPCQGHQWSVEVKSYKSPLLPHSALQPTSPPSLPSPPHLSLHSSRRRPLGAWVSFVFGAMAPVEGLQGIRGSGGQLLLCFNWHYHFRRLTEMNHLAGPCYCWYWSRGVEVEGWGEERKKVSTWWAQEKQIRGEKNVLGRKKRKMKGRSEEINLTQTSA